MEQFKFLRLITGLMLSTLLVTGAFAQFDDTSTGSTTETTEETTSSTPSYTPTPSYTSSYGSTTEKSAPRTAVYNAVMQNNAAADFTTADYMLRPHLIGEKQYVSASALAPTVLGTNGSAYFALQAANMAWFGGYDVTAGTNQRVQLGVAMGELFGAGILYEFNRAYTKDAAENKAYTTAVGDAYGVFGSFALGSRMSIYANLNRVTAPVAATKTEPAGAGATDVEVSSATTNITAGFALDADEELSHAVLAQVAISLGGAEDDVSPKTIDQGATTMALTVGYGIPMILKEEYAVYAGANAGYTYVKNDNDIANTENTWSNILVSPNINFRKKIGKGFEAQLGASLALINYTSNPIDLGTTDTEATALNTSLFPNLGLGLRWVTGTFAIEGQVNPTVITNGPDFISGAGSASAAPVPMLTSLGITAGF
ncbi:MAG: hypothetical protein HQK83_11540 [Fibrobacteria bacterium]|nr:hypothetical protein [Fibrobacteria bacterium]